MSTISGVSGTPYVPTSNAVQPQTAPQTQPPATATPPVAQDADGDNDGSKSGKIDTYA